MLFHHHPSEMWVNQSNGELNRLPRPRKGRPPVAFPQVSRLGIKRFLRGFFLSIEWDNSWISHHGFIYIYIYNIYIIIYNIYIIYIYMEGYFLAFFWGVLPMSIFFVFFPFNAAFRQGHQNNSELHKR